MAYTVDYGVPTHEINITTAQDGKFGKNIYQLNGCNKLLVFIGFMFVKS